MPFWDFVMVAQRIPAFEKGDNYSDSTLKKSATLTLFFNYEQRACANCSDFHLKRSANTRPLMPSPPALPISPLGPAAVWVFPAPLS